MKVELIEAGRGGAECERIMRRLQLAVGSSFKLSTNVDRPPVGTPVVFDNRRAVDGVVEVMVL